MFFFVVFVGLEMVLDYGRFNILLCIWGWFLWWGFFYWCLVDFVGDWVRGLCVG